MPLLDHEDRAKEGYDRQAEVYDEDRYVTYQGRLILDLFRTELLQWVDRGKPGRILDVATGTGIGAACYFGDVARVFGVDLSRNMMSKAKSRAQSADTEFPLTQANARLMPFASGSFRGVFSFRLFHHVPHGHRRPIIDEIERILAPGGIAVLDFKNSFYGLIINQIYDYILRDDQGHYLFPWQVKSLFSGLEVVAKRGVYMPFAQRLARINERCGKVYLSLGRLWPFKYLCSNLFVVVRKVSGSTHSV